jgi:CRP-like cAMP-binding protein
MKDIVGFLAGVPLFRGLPPQDIRKLAGTTRERQMRAGETLFQRGDPGTSMMLVLAGEVRVELPDFSGAHLVLQVLRRGEAFGELALFDGKPRSADVVAVTHGRLLVLERAAVLDRMQAEPGFAIRVAEVLCDRLRRTNAKLEALRFRDAGQRICLFLLQQHQETGVSNLDITQAALAEIVGATRETVNRRLAEMEAAGAIARKPGRITLLDRSLLQARLTAS